MLPSVNVWGLDLSHDAGRCTQPPVALTASDFGVPDMLWIWLNGYPSGFLVARVLRKLGNPFRRLRCLRQWSPYSLPGLGRSVRNRSSMLPRRRSLGGIHGGIGLPSADETLQVRATGQVGSPVEEARTRAAHPEALAQAVQPHVGPCEALVLARLAVVSGLSHTRDRNGKHRSPVPE